MSRGIGGHHRGHKGRSDEWLTPPEIVRALGPFETDPCSPIKRPWPTATVHYTRLEDGLSRRWEGRVFLNPPYGPDTGRWLAALAEHGNGIALIFARTETEMFCVNVWGRADAVLFLQGRLHFYTLDGQMAVNNAGGPSVLIAYGRTNAQRLARCGLAGKFINLRRNP